MNPFTLITREFKAIDLGSENQDLHDQLRQAVKENRTLRHEFRQENGKSVSYLRERTWAEFGQETLDRIFGKGEIAAAAKARAWEAVHQALNGKIVCIDAAPTPKSGSLNRAVPKRTTTADLEGELWARRSALKASLLEARTTAKAIYSHILGRESKSSEIAILSKRLSIRCDTHASERASALSGSEDPFAEAVAAMPATIFDGSILLSMQNCVTEFYQKELKNAKRATADVELRYVHFRYKADEAYCYGFNEEVWRVIHIDALKEAIRKLPKQEPSEVPIVIVVDDAQTLSELREGLDYTESDELTEFYRRAREASSGPSQSGLA